MQGLTRDRLFNNAYRILGLPATAGQAEIDQAARRMRIWPDPQRIPPTAWDLAWLGPVPRTRNDIEQAVARLADPLTRFEERILWFSPGSEALNACQIGDLEDAVSQLASGHEAAIASLLAAVLLDPGMTDEDRWRWVVEQARRVAESDEYLQWLLEVDRQGDFEKPANAEEAGAALRELPAAVCALISAKAAELLDNGQLAEGQRLLAMARGSTPDELGTQMEERVLDRMEDELEQRCREMEGHLQANLRCEPDQFAGNAVSNETTARSGASFYSTQVEPALDELQAAACDEPDRVQRARTRAARCLGMLATAWIWSANFVAADSVFARAMELARGTALEPMLRADREENAVRARRQRMAGSGTSARAAHASHAPTSYTTTTRIGGRYVPPRSSSSSHMGAGWAGALIVLVLALLRVGMSLPSHSRPDSRQPYYSAPSYSPSPWQSPSQSPTGTPNYQPGSPYYQPGVTPGQPSYNRPTVPTAPRPYTPPSPYTPSTPRGGWNGGGGGGGWSGGGGAGGGGGGAPSGGGFPGHR